MKTLRVSIGFGMLLASTAAAQQVSSFADLEVILDDQIVIEDFEGISLHAGGTLPVPNPLNSITVQKLGFNWDLDPGVSYESPSALSIHSGFIGGEEDIYLQSEDSVEISFDVPQVAFGLNLIGFSIGNAYTLSVYDRNNVLIEAFEKPSDNGSFIGYQSPTRGVSRVTIIHSTFSTILVNNFTFGRDFISCPADINNDGAHNFFDVSAFLGFFSEEDDRADFNDDGQFNFFDVSGFLNAFTIACP